MDGQDRQPEPKPTRILVAEDDPVNQYVFRAILASAGYEVEMVGNGLLAVERAAAVRPRLILLDMMMPVMDGYEAAARLCLNPALDDVPILAVTAKAMKGDLERTIEAGCDGYISKPVDRTVLLALLREWLGKPPSEWLASRRARRQRAA